MFFFDEKEKDFVFKPRSVEFAYLAVLNDNLPAAKSVFESIDSSRALWGVSLVEILSGFAERIPTYFEIRNFMEIDLDFLIKNKKIDYVEQLLGSLEFLSNINREVYKYTARVMQVNKLYNASIKYMEKAKEIFYNDPELQFMLAKYYLTMQEYKKADYCISECLKFIPSYFPAIKLKKELADHL